jgi:hypothetical protein
MFYVIYLVKIKINQNKFQNNLRRFEIKKISLKLKHIYLINILYFLNIFYENICFLDILP